MDFWYSLSEFVQGMADRLWWLLAVVAFGSLDFSERFKHLVPQRWRDDARRWLTRWPSLGHKLAKARPPLQVLWISLLSIAAFLTYHDTRMKWVALVADRDSRIAALEASGDSKAEHQKKADLLSSLLEEGNALFNRRATTPEELTTLEKDATEWVNRAVSEIKTNLSSGEATLFISTNGRVSMSYGFAFNNVHDAILNNLDAWLTNLRSLLAKYT